MSNGDPGQFITEFIQYLVSVSTKSSSILREQFAPVFEALKQTSVPNRDESKEDQLAQILVDIQGPVVEKPIDANPGLKIYQVSYFSVPKR